MGDLFAELLFKGWFWKVAGFVVVWIGVAYISYPFFQSLHSPDPSGNSQFLGFAVAALATYLIHRASRTSVTIVKTSWRPYPTPPVGSQVHPNPQDTARSQSSQGLGYGAPPEHHARQEFYQAETPVARQPAQLQSLQFTLFLRGFLSAILVSFALFLLARASNIPSLYFAISDALMVFTFVLAFVILSTLLHVWKDTVFVASGWDWKISTMAILCLAAAAIGMTVYEEWQREQYRIRREQRLKAGQVPCSSIRTTIECGLAPNCEWHPDVRIRCRSKR